MQPSKVEQLSNNEGSEGHGSSAGRHGALTCEAAEKKNQSFIPSGGKVLTFLPGKCSDGDASMSVCDCRRPHSILMISLEWEEKSAASREAVHLRDNIISFLSMK